MPLPWARYQELAGGVLGWSQEQTVNSTMRFLFLSLDGFAEKNGVKKKSHAPSRERIEELKRRYR